MRTSLTIILIFLMGVCISCNRTPKSIPESGLTPDTLGLILVNQVGYLPEAEKIALLRIRTGKFDVVELASGKIVFSGEPGPFTYWGLSGDSASTADFSKVVAPGNYQICINDTIYSYVFEIGPGIYNELAKASLKAFYLNRSGTEITTEFGGQWARAAGHPDTMVLIHSSAGTVKRPEGTKISSPGGWYDAGDYNKYIVNSAISTYTLLLFCQMYPGYCKDLKSNIPESNNNIPDVMDELLVNLRWMLTMQDPNDGGVYHKLTNKTFCDFVMPDKANDPRYVVSKSTAASLDFAATMAMASRVFLKTDFPELITLGKTCLEASQKAFTWAKANPAIYYKNPSDISTGAYDDMNLSDEFFWASVELGLAEKKTSFISKQDIVSQKHLVQSWDNVGFLGILSLALCDHSALPESVTEAQKVLLAYAGLLAEKSVHSPYLISIDNFKWGSNSDVANHAILKLAAYKLEPDKKYLDSVQSDIDYLLGRNATGYSFVTGYGDKKAMKIHHRPSGADGIAEPCPGFLVGGPNTIVMTDCPGITRSSLPARSYVDAECSYSTNEVAINWNAPLFFVMGAMDALTLKK